MSNEHSVISDDIVVVDVGCRWGFADQFVDELSSFRLFGFDPDKNECDRLSNLYNSDRVTLVPLGLGDTIGSAKLYLTKEPACSSLFQPNKQLIDSCPALECAREVGQIDIELTTLDSWAKQAQLSHIDYLKIDTQGAELLVLKGAEKILSTVRVIEVEVEFNPIYNEQPLFSDVDIYLRKQGFVLWKLTNLVHYGHDKENEIELGDDRIHFDEPFQLFKKRGGQLHWADAHYIRADMLSDTLFDKKQMIRDEKLLGWLGHNDIQRRLQVRLCQNG